MLFGPLLFSPMQLGGLAMRILLAEDTQATRVALQLALETAGHEVTGVSNGLDALQRSEAETFDVAVLDIWMPQQSGLDVLKTLRARGNAMPVVLISGGGPGASLEYAAALGDAYGASAILFKPINDEELLRAVAQAA